MMYVRVLFILLRALSSFDGLDFTSVKQHLDSTEQSVDVADSDAYAGQSWLSATGSLELARRKLLRAVTALHIENDSDHARSVFVLSVK